MPYFVVWKNGIPAGKPYDGLVSSLDIFATAIDAASISMHRSLQLVFVSDALQT